MKSLPLLILLLFFSFTLFSQKIIENPKHGLTTVPNLDITKVELSDSITVLTFELKNPPGAKILIPGGSCIQPVGFEKKYYVKRSEGIPMNVWYEFDNSGVVNYSLIFPAIDPETARIDFLEDNEGGSWFIYDIRLKDNEKINPLLADIQNIWFNTSGNKLMTIALYDTVAVYQSQLWSYGAIEQKGKAVKVELINNSGSQTLYFQSIDKNTCMMGASKKQMVELYTWPKDIADRKAIDETPYSEPILKKGIATYSGYIRDYTSRAGFKTGIAHVNNILTGSQESYTIKIRPNGYFSVSIPMINPEEIYLDIPVVNRTVFLEPGKETFQLIDGNNPFNGLLFQGETAMVNNGLFELKDIKFYNYGEAMDSILKMNTEEYKTYYGNIRQHEFQALQDTAQKKFISAKAFQVKKENIECNYLQGAVGYKMNYYSALYQKKGKNAGVSMSDIPKLEDHFYSFLTSDILNNPLLMLSTNYSSFINRFKYSDFLRDDQKKNSLSVSKLAEYIQSKGVELTPEDRTLLEHQKKIEANQEKWKPFNEKYGEISKSFFQTYSDTIKEISKSEEFVLWYDLEGAFAQKGIQLTNEEHEMIGAAKTIMSRDEFLSLKSNKDSGAMSAGDFFNKYQTYSSEFHRKMQTAARKEVMEKKLGVENSLVADVMNAQDILNGIVEQLTPVSDEELNKVTSKIETPFIASYIAFCNDRTIKKVEELKTKTGYIVNQTPEVDSDQLFEKMMEKFKGKVVFVDFWATWCGPCRSGLERMKPLKEELKESPIVFLCVTNESSPEGTWKAMIVDIGGEHYRLNNDEWNILSERFGVSGIPHYVLVDKEGKVAKNNGMPTYDETAMRKLFEEYMAK